MTLIELWDGTGARERWNFIVHLVKLYPSLICGALREHKKCPEGEINPWDETERK